MKEKAEKYKIGYINNLSELEKKEFVFILNQYQNSLIGKTKIYYDILLHLSTIDFQGRTIPYERETKCFNCSSDLNEKKNFICKTCGWYICGCGACGCSEVKKISKLKFPKYYTKDVLRKKSTDINNIIDNYELPITQNDLDKIFKSRAILQFQKNENMLEEFNRMLKRHRNVELGVIDDSEINIKDLLKNL